MRSHWTASASTTEPGNYEEILMAASQLPNEFRYWSWRPCLLTMTLPSPSPSFNSLIMGSSCVISHAVSAKHSSTGLQVNAVITFRLWNMLCLPKDMIQLSTVTIDGCAIILKHNCHKPAPPHSHYPIKCRERSVIMYWLELTIDLII